MKRFLFAFLMLLMLTPGFACAMPMCGGAPGHCPHHHDKSMSGPMLMQDCAKVDLQAAGAPVIKKPDMSGQIFLIADTGIPGGESFHPGNSAIIRGPPPGWPGISQTQPPILLTTLRLRQ
jgi:hypothetical protein